MLKSFKTRALNYLKEERHSKQSIKDGVIRFSTRPDKVRKIDKLSAEISTLSKTIRILEGMREDSDE